MFLDCYYQVANFVYNQPLTLIVGIWLLIEIVMMIRKKKTGRVWWFIKRFFWLGVLLFVMKDLLPFWVQSLVIGGIAIYALAMALGD